MINPKKKKSVDTVRKSKAYKETILKKSLLNQAKCKETVFAWQKKLFELSVPDETLIEAGKYLTPTDFDEVVEERQVSNLCGYPLCANHMELSTSKANFKIDISERKVYSISNKKKYCSMSCHKASVYFKAQLVSEPLFLKNLKTLCPIQLLSDALKESNLVNENTVTKAAIENYKLSIPAHVLGTVEVDIKESIMSRDVNEGHLPQHDSVEGFRIDTQSLMPKSAMNLAQNTHYLKSESSSLDTIVNETEEIEAEKSEVDGEYHDADWFDDEEQDEIGVALSRFGKIWVFLDHLVTDSTKKFLGSTQFTQPTHESEIIHTSRKTIFTQSMLKTYGTLRKQLKIPISLHDPLISLTKTFHFRDNQLMSNLQDEWTICIVLMRILSLTIVPELQLCENEWSSLIQKAGFSMVELKIFSDIFLK